MNGEDPSRLFHRQVSGLLFAAIFILICSLSMPDAHSQAMARTGTITFNGSYVDTAAIDQNSGQAYFGTESGTIVRIDLSTFTQTGILILGEGGFSTAVIDSKGGFAYFGTDSFPARIVKIDLSNFSPAGVRTFLGVSKFTSAFLGTDDYVYFVGYCEPNTDCTFPQRSMILKIDISKFESVGIRVLGGIVGLSAITAYDYAYIGAYDDGQRIGEIIEVDLSTLNLVTTLTLGQREVPKIGVIDSYGSSAYFLLSADLYDEPKSIVKVDLSSLTFLATLTPAGNLGLGAIAIDSANNIAFIGTNTVPGRILKVELATFKLVETLVLDKGEDNVVSAIVDTVHNFAYFGIHTSPGKIVRVALALPSTTSTSATSTAMSISANSTMSSVGTEHATSGTTANAIFSATTSTSSPQSVFWTPLTAIGIQIVSAIIAAVIAGVILYLLFDRKKKTSAITIGEVQRAGTVVQNIYVGRSNDPESSKRIIEEIPDQLFVGEPRAHREPIQGQHSDDLRGLIKKVTQSALGSDPLTPIVADALGIARTLKKDEESRWLERELYGYEKRPTDQPNTFPDYRRVSAKIPIQVSGITALGELSENFDIDRTLFVSFSVKRLEDTVNGARSRGAIELVLWMTTPKELSDLAKEQNAQVTSEKTGKTPFLIQINDLERLLSELRLRIHRFATSLATD